MLSKLLKEMLNILTHLQIQMIKTVDLCVSRGVLLKKILQYPGKLLRLNSFGILPLSGYFEREPDTPFKDHEAKPHACYITLCI